MLLRLAAKALKLGSVLVGLKFTLTPLIQELLLRLAAEALKLGSVLVGLKFTLTPLIHGDRAGDKAAVGECG